MNATKVTTPQGFKRASKTVSLDYKQQEIDDEQTRFLRKTTGMLSITSTN